jgi:hypothetical protein
MALTYPNLAIPFLQTIKLDCGKGYFSIKRKKPYAAYRVNLCIGSSSGSSKTHNFEYLCGYVFIMIPAAAKPYV